MFKQIHIFFTAPLCSNQRCTLLNTVNDFDSCLTNIYNSVFTHIFLFGKASLDISANTLMRNAAMNYIISTNRYEESLF